MRWLYAAFAHNRSRDFLADYLAEVQVGQDNLGGAEQHQPPRAINGAPGDEACTDHVIEFLQLGLGVAFGQFSDDIHERLVTRQGLRTLCVRLNGCGSRSRTCDLQIMNLTSYRLLYPASDRGIANGLSCNTAKAHYFLVGRAQKCRARRLVDWASTGLGLNEQDGNYGQ